MSRGFKINKPVVAQFMRELQQEFDQHQIRVGVDADKPVMGTTINYNGPVIFGDANGAQLAWNNEKVSQHQTEKIAAGYEDLARAVVDVLRQLPAAGLAKADQENTEEAARSVLQEVTQPTPDSGRVKWAVAALKGFLATALISVASTEVQEWIKAAITNLGTQLGN